MKDLSIEIFKDMGITPEIYEYGESIWNSLKDRFEEVDAVSEYNQIKVIQAMIMYKIVR